MSVLLEDTVSRLNVSERSCGIKICMPHVRDI